MIKNRNKLIVTLATITTFKYKTLIWKTRKTNIRLENNTNINYSSLNLNGDLNKGKRKTIVIIKFLPPPSKHV